MGNFGERMLIIFLCILFLVMLIISILNIYYFKEINLNNDTQIPDSTSENLTLGNFLLICFEVTCLCGLLYVLYIQYQTNLRITKLETEKLKYDIKREILDKPPTEPIIYSERVKQHKKTTVQEIKPPTIQAVPPVEDVPLVEVPSIEVPPVEVSSVEVPPVQVPPVEAVPPVEVSSVQVPPVEDVSVEVPPVEVSLVEVPPVEEKQVKTNDVEESPLDAPEIPSENDISFSQPEDSPVIQPWQKDLEKRNASGESSKSFIEKIMGRRLR